MPLNTFTHTVTSEKVDFRSIGLIAGGSGITPVLQVSEALLATQANVKIGILYANQTEGDILCRDELNRLERDHPTRIKVWYTLDRPPTEGWKYSSGFINEEMVKEHLPKASEHTVTFMCGPPPMIKFACIPNLLKVGHAETTFFSF